MAVKKPGVTGICGTAKKAAVKATKKGDAYICSICGLAVTVDEACGCVGVHEIICCGEVMEPKKAKAVASKATATKKKAKATAKK
jgi:hypothetical protein